MQTLFSVGIKLSKETKNCTDIFEGTVEN